jgi:hypothetical protein
MMTSEKEFKEFVEAVSKPRLTQFSDFGLFGGERSRRHEGLPSFAHG